MQLYKQVARLVHRSMLLFLAVPALHLNAQNSDSAWIRISQLGYPPAGVKVAVWCSKTTNLPAVFELIDSASGKTVLKAATGKVYGAYGPFSQTCRLNFSRVKKAGTYYLKCGSALSPVFRISENVYKGIADFTLRYLRQQRSGYNPFLRDSCHNNDGYTMYGPMPDSTHVEVSGGWHDATDYLQYATTSANATYHLLAAYRDFPAVFTDHHLANGLPGENGTADVLDEGRWGLDWLMKMNPRPDWIFSQLADDRDHAGFRLPTRDSVDYGPGPGKGRPVYFVTGKPQGLGKYQNHTTGSSSIAGKFSSAFALGAQLYREADPALADSLSKKAIAAYKYGLNNPGFTQTAPNREPYFYEESNWVDDMELAAAAIYQLSADSGYRRKAMNYAAQEPVTPWMGTDTARHYQWYPFHNFGHYELARASVGKPKAQLISWYKEGIERVWARSAGNAFYHGTPFIWCSNNLITSFTIQCYLYRQLSGDNSFAELEEAGFDWVMGCNPWGKTMVYGLGSGDSPLHPHSSLSFLYHYPLDGGLVDGPVYGSIFKNLRGLKLYEADKYAAFQSELVVYHDDVGDYSTNEPTMDGTASLVYLLAEKESGK